jgi:hypothetical protein
MFWRFVDWLLTLLGDPLKGTMPGDDMDNLPEPKEEDK